MEEGVKDRETNREKETPGKKTHKKKWRKRKKDGGGDK